MIYPIQRSIWVMMMRTTVDHIPVQSNNVEPKLREGHLLREPKCLTSLLVCSYLKAQEGLVHLLDPSHLRSVWSHLDRNPPDPSFSVTFLTLPLPPPPLCALNPRLLPLSWGLPFSNRLCWIRFIYQFFSIPSPFTYLPTHPVHLIESCTKIHMYQTDSGFL